MQKEIETNRNILVIDDNDAIHRDFDKILGMLNADDLADELGALDAELFGDLNDTVEEPKISFTLVHASQGKEGFERLQEATSKGESFGVAFVDMTMPPGWDGVETIENLWKVDPHLQVVICTAFSDHSWDDISQRLGKTDRLLVLKSVR